MLIKHLASHCVKLLQEGRVAEAEAECNKALEERLTPHQKSRFLYLRAHIGFQRAGKWTPITISDLRDSLEGSQKLSEHRGRVLAALTQAYAAVCSVPFCREGRDAFVELYQSKPTSRLAQWRPDVEYNLAIAYHEEDRLDEAEDAYLVAYDLCIRSQDPYVRSLLPHIQHNLVDVFQELDRHEEAYRLVQAAYADLSEETHGAQKRNRLAAYALYKGDLDAAVLWVESGLGHPSCDARTRAALTLTKAKIALAAGSRTEAKALALEAKRMATAAGSNRLSRRADSFLIQLGKGEEQ